MQAQWVIAENKRLGTTAWRIRHPKGSIAGFASRTYARAGQRITLYVTTAARTFRAEAFRMGYYHGTGARLVWQSPEIAGRVQASCPVTAGVNMVHCDGWKTYLVQNDVLTWQAWNAWGGYDYYQGLGNCPAGEYPLCSRARVVSFDRPYRAEHGSGNFLKLEYPLVRFAEKHGLDVTYTTDVAIAQHPRSLRHHRVLLSLGHDECWSLAGRTAAVTAHDRGINIVFFGASPILRHVRLHSSPLGPGRDEVDYRDARADPLDGKASPLQVTGNTWGSSPANWPESYFVGEMYAGFLEPGRQVSLVVTDASSWAYRGTGLRNGSAVPGVIGMDVDHFYAAMIHPANVQVLAHSPIPPDMGQTDIGAFYSDMTYYTDRHGRAGVLDTGTTNWIPALAHDRSGCGARRRPAGSHCASAVIQRITGNILRVFGAGPAGRLHPSIANWQRHWPVTTR